MIHLLVTRGIGVWWTMEIGFKVTDFTNNFKGLQENNTIYSRWLVWAQYIIPKISQDVTHFLCCRELLITMNRKRLKPWCLQYNVCWAQLGHLNKMAFCEPSAFPNVPTFIDGAHRQFVDHLTSSLTGAEPSSRLSRRPRDGRVKGQWAMEGRRPIYVLSSPASFWWVTKDASTRRRIVNLRLQQILLLPSTCQSTGRSYLLWWCRQWCFHLYFLRWPNKGLNEMDWKWKEKVAGRTGELECRKRPTTLVRQNKREIKPKPARGWSKDLLTGCRTKVSGNNRKYNSWTWSAPACSGLCQSCETGTWPWLTSQTPDLGLLGERHPASGQSQCRWHVDDGFSFKNQTVLMTEHHGIQHKYNTSHIVQSNGMNTRCTYMKTV